MSNMVQLIEAETSAFWTEKEKMGSDLGATQGLASEDVVSPNYLAEFKKEKIDILASILLKPKGDMTTLPNQGQGDHRKTVQKSVLRFGIKSQQRVLA